MALAAIGLIASCELIPAIAPDDFAPWHGQPGILDTTFKGNVRNEHGKGG
jgi:hypothetical protein